jgi:hypothetical protein
MGIFSFFRTRSASESAMLTAQQQAAIDEAMTQAQSQSQGQMPAGWTQPTPGEGPGALAGIGMLISQLQAMQTAGLDIETNSQVVDLRGTDVKQEIMGVIAAHGIDPTKEGQEIDASTAPQLQNDILAVLSRAGLDMSAAGFPIPDRSAGPKEPEEPLDPSVPQIRNPFDR